MRVICPGHLWFDGRTLVVSGWYFDPEGEPPTTEAIATCALQFVAQSKGLTITAGEPEPPIEVQRQTLRLIKRVQVEALMKRPWWRFW